MRLRFFPALALTMALLTVILIVIGAVVRVSNSGFGCGDNWPLCNGTIFPPLSNINAWIEWTHRLVALLIGICGLVALVLAVRDYRKQKRAILFAIILAALLYSVQDMLGRAVVLNELNPLLVMVHLATAMILLASFLVAAILSNYVPKRHYARDRFTTLAFVTTALSLLIIFTGAYVRGSGATLACLTWPACNGEIFPMDQGALAAIQMFHRLAVALLGVTLLALVVSAWKYRSGRIRTLAALALIAYLCQAGIGALVVFSFAADVWAAAHVGVAAVTWGLLVTLSVIESLNTGERLESEWQPQSEPLLN